MLIIPIMGMRGAKWAKKRQALPLPPLVAFFPLSPHALTRLPHRFRIIRLFIHRAVLIAPFSVFIPPIPQLYF